MRSLSATVLIVIALLSGQTHAAEKLALGSDQLVIDGKNAFLNGKKISCIELAGATRENWGGVFLDERCVQHRTIPINVFPPKVVFVDTQKERYTNGQWQFRMVESDPVAIFLDSQYSRVVFRGTCESAGVLWLKYYADARDTKLKRGDSIALLLDGHRNDIEVKSLGRSGGDLSGIVPLTPAFMRAIAAAKEITLDVQNENGAPWYMGSAPALKRLAKACL
jgi:hypothetical protein